MRMLTYTELLRHLDGMTRQEVIALAQAAGIPEGTLLKVKTRETQNPGIKLVEAVSALLKSHA